MPEIRFISGVAALGNFLHGIKEEVSGELRDQNINASGALDRSNRVAVFSDGFTTTGEITALSHWKNAGSGTPRGTKVGFLTLAQWAIDKGLASSQDRAERIGALVSAKILREGSKAWREGGKNIYTEVIKAAQPGTAKVVRAFVSDVARPVQSAFKALK